MKDKMKVYIAGPLCTPKEREFVEKIDKLCKKLKLDTFLPHRDCGLWKSQADTKRIAKGDIVGFEKCDFVIGNLNGFNVGAGTAWEMGYAYSRGIPVIGLKTDRKIKDSISELSAIIVGSTKIVESFKELEEAIKMLIKKEKKTLN